MAAGAPATEQATQVIKPQKAADKAPRNDSTLVLAPSEANGSGGAGDQGDQAAGRHLITAR